jgi:hypothetical protein
MKAITKYNLMIILVRIMLRKGWKGKAGRLVVSKPEYIYRSKLKVSDTNPTTKNSNIINSSDRELGGQKHCQNTSWVCHL